MGGGCFFEGVVGELGGGVSVSVCVSLSVSLSVCLSVSLDLKSSPLPHKIKFIHSVSVKRPQVFSTTLVK